MGSGGREAYHEEESDEEEMTGHFPGGSGAQQVECRQQ